MAERTLLAVARDGGLDCYYVHDAPDAARVPAVEPRLRVPSLSALAGRLNYAEFERVVTVDDDTHHLAVWFGPPDRDAPGARPPHGDGALVPVPDVGTADARDRWRTYTRGWVEGVKSTAWDAVVAGLLAPEGARSYLSARVREYAPGAVVGDTDEPPE